MQRYEHETGAAIDVNYVSTRARWEPLYEVTQERAHTSPIWYSPP